MVMATAAGGRPPGPAQADGRKLRREQNREAVVDALLALFRDGNYQPSAADIAARSGLSLRSLFRYFDDIDDLHRAAAARQIAVVMPLLAVGIEPDAPTLDKIRALVRSRVRLFEEIGPSARALRACAHRHEPLAAELARNRAFFRTQIEVLFAPEAASSASEAGNTSFLPALDVLCSFESYELLRTDRGMSRARVETTLIEAISALVRQEVLQ
jgi:AcrR family transcriptional regulator